MVTTTAKPARIPCLPDDNDRGSDTGISRRERVLPQERLLGSPDIQNEIVLHCGRRGGPKTHHLHRSDLIIGFLTTYRRCAKYAVEDLLIHQAADEVSDSWAHTRAGNIN